jgi:hypothetical protein
MDLKTDLQMITPTKDLVNKHLGMMRIDLNKFFTIMKEELMKGIL